MSAVLFGSLIGATARAQDFSFQGQQVNQARMNLAFGMTADMSPEAIARAHSMDKALMLQGQMAHVMFMANQVMADSARKAIAERERNKRQQIADGTSLFPT